MHIVNFIMRPIGPPICPPFRTPWHLSIPLRDASSSFGSDHTYTKTSSIFPNLRTFRRIFIDKKPEIFFSGWPTHPPRPILIIAWRNKIKKKKNKWSIDRGRIEPFQAVNPPSHKGTLLFYCSFCLINSNAFF